MPEDTLGREVTMDEKAVREGKHVAMERCYYCGGDKSVILSTRLRNISHLDNKVIDMEPCNRCKEYMKDGVIVVSIRDGEPREGDPPNPYRTGGWWVLTVEAVKRIFNIDFTEKLRKFMFIEDGAAEKIGLKKENLQTGTTEPGEDTKSPKEPDY